MILVFNVCRPLGRRLGIACLIVVLLVLSIIGRSHKAHAEALPPEDRRTVTWYVAHPAFMHRLLAACRNDPGHAATNADCQNAKHGEMAEYEAQARDRLRLPALLSPADPRFYILHPDQLQYRLDLCRQFPPDVHDVRGAWCVAARSQSSHLAAR